MVFTVVTFIIKNVILSIVSGLGWTLIAIYLFVLYYSGDPDYGYMTYGFAWMATIMCMAMYFSTWWVHRKQTTQIQQGKSFYDSEFKDEFKDIEEIYEARRKVRKLRKG